MFINSNDVAIKFISSKSPTCSVCTTYVIQLIFQKVFPKYVPLRHRYKSLRQGPRPQRYTVYLGKPLHLCVSPTTSYSSQPYSDQLLAVRMHVKCIIVNHLPH